MPDQKTFHCISTTVLGDKHFSVSNGYDTIEARFVYARGSGSERTKPHWDVTGAGTDCSLYMKKDELFDHLAGILTTPLSEPMNEDQAVRMQEKDGSIHGIVQVSVRELAGCGDELPTLLCERLVATSLKHAIYDRHIIVAVDQEADSLCICVQAHLE